MPSIPQVMRSLHTRRRAGQGPHSPHRRLPTAGPAPAPAPAPPPAAAAAAAAAQPAACRLCAECYGKGMVAETYNHRTLERCCTQCGGQGTVRNEGGSGGGSSTHSGSGGSTHNVRSSAQSGGTHSSSSSAKGVHERLAGWEAELEALKQSLAGVSDAQELQLTAALILELERAAAALRKGVAAAKQVGTAGGTGALFHGRAPA